MFILGLTELLGLQAQGAEVGVDDGEQLRVHRRVPADCCKYFLETTNIFTWRAPRSPCTPSSAWCHSTQLKNTTS